MLITLVYSSTSAHPMENSQLRTMLSESKARNEQAHITGMLLYKDSNFFQVLEGEEHHVERLFAKIRQDKRHHEIITYLKEPIHNRKFDDWEMGFFNLDLAENKQLSGFTDFLSNPRKSERLRDATSEVHMLLDNFQKNFA